ncbi:MAG: chromate transporter [Beijerinckiaceae bacterium]|nr:chromate transporter [Beijerinckiaceae bacterium]
MDALSLPPPEAPHVTRLGLFTAFLKIGVLGFGGVAALARHILVVERGWLSEREFAELFGLASTLPGANTVNLATMLGDRAAGLTGVLAALAGLVGAPLVILVAIILLYSRFADVPDVRAALTGAAAATAGLVLGTALKLLRGLEPDAVMVVVVAVVFAATALARLPIFLVLAVTIPSCLLLAFWRNRRRGR